MSMTTATKSRGIAAVTAALVAALIVATPAPVAAQQHGKALAGARVAGAHRQQIEDEEEAATPKQPGEEGIKVHGLWMIEVHDKDGKLVEHREFHNSLTGTGAGILLRLLDGTAVAEKMAIELNASNTTTVYTIVAPGSANATLLCSTAANYQCSTTAMQKLKQSDQSGNPSSLVVSGMLTADRALTFTHVSTPTTICHNAVLDNNANSQNQVPVPVSPTDCDAGNYTNPINQGGGLFTGTDITPLSISQDQVLTVSVTISFS